MMRDPQPPAPAGAPPKPCAECAEKLATIRALGHEKDELRAKAGAAEARRDAAELRARRIVLDAELKERAEAAEARCAALEQQAQERAAQALSELSALLREAYERGHYDWPTTDVPTLEARRDAFVREVLSRLPASSEAQK